MPTPTLADVLLLIRPGAQWNLSGDTLAGLVWHDTIQAQPTQGEIDTAVSSFTTLKSTADLTSQRASAVTQLLSDPSPNAKFIRSVLLVALDEINLLREWFESFKAATAAATTLADLKTRVAGLSAMPDRTVAQLKTATQNKINSGTAD